MGMTFPLMSKDISCKQVAVVAVIISLSTEIIQIITKHGWFETKDILTNVLGAILGFWIYSRILNK